MNNTDKMYEEVYQELQQELMDMEYGEVRFYRVHNFDALHKALSTINPKVLNKDVTTGYAVTITRHPLTFSLKVLLQGEGVVLDTRLPSIITDELSLVIKTLVYPEVEVQQEPIPTLYRFTQHYFGVPKNSTFSLIKGWLESDDPNVSLGSFITCTFLKDGKPEEITFWVTKSHIKELIKKCILKEGPYNERQQVYLNVLKLYWMLSEEGRKDHFKLVYQDPSVSQYRYKMDETVVISVPSKYPPYSDFIPSEVGNRVNDEPFIMCRCDHVRNEDFDSYHSNSTCCSDMKTYLGEIRSRCCKW